LETGARRRRPTAKRAQNGAFFTLAWKARRETALEFADEVLRNLTDQSPHLVSGALHDAAEAAKAGVPTVMLFVQSLRGISHNKAEDTKPEHLELAVKALNGLTSLAMKSVAVN
jgi:hypothetical protein